MWFFIDPFTHEVWIGIVISIPLYLLAMGIANYLYGRSVDMDAVTGFIIRNALSEHKSRLPSHTRAYQKILLMTWIWSMIILVQAYVGNLKAMLAKPNFQAPIKTFEDLLTQNEISWGISQYSSADHYMRNSAQDSLLKRLHDRAVVIPIKSGHACFTKEMEQKGGIAAICERPQITAMISKDYSKTGQCNYYVTEDQLLTAGRAMAFQVKHAFIEESPTSHNVFQKGSPYLEDFNYLIRMSFEMGLPLDKSLEKYVPNATKCSTWHDVKASHMKDDQNIVVQLDDIYGMTIILALGISGSVVLLIAEIITKAKGQRPQNPCK